MANPTKKGSLLPLLSPAVAAKIEDRLFSIIDSETSIMSPDSLRLFLQEAIQYLIVTGNIEAAGFTIEGVPLGTSTDTFFNALGLGKIGYSGGPTAIELEAIADAYFDGYRILNSATISEMKVTGKGLHFNGVDQSVTIADDPNVNVGTGDFSVNIDFDFDSLGSENRVLYNKGSNPRISIYLNFTTQKLQFFIYDGTTTNAISTDTALVTGQSYSAECRGDRSGDMSIVLNGKLQSETLPTPELTLTNTEKMYLGTLRTTAQFLEGSLKRTQLFNYLSSVEAAISRTSNPLKQPEFKDIGGSQVPLTSGLVIIGKTYRTDLFIAGDDFTNVADIGASANVTGAVWTAIATTPTTWTNLSELIREGLIAYYPSHSLSHERWNDESGNDNDGAVDATLFGQKTIEDYNPRYKSYATDGNTIEVPVGTTDLSIKLNIKTAEAGTTLRIGTTPGGQEVVADIATTSTGLTDLLMLITNFVAGDILYLGSDGGAAWTTLDFDMYVKYTVYEGI